MSAVTDTAPHSTGAGAPSSTGTADAVPFSRLVRERSGARHGSSESASFMSELTAGRATRADYTALVVQHWAIYEALEGAADALREHPLVAPFLSADLDRLPSLERDLAALQVNCRGETQCHGQAIRVPDGAGESQRLLDLVLRLLRVDRRRDDALPGHEPICPVRACGAPLHISSPV